jgi:hypothetical protein
MFLKLNIAKTSPCISLQISSLQKLILWNAHCSLLALSATHPAFVNAELLTK